jgi:hypothetical protein
MQAKFFAAAAGAALSMVLASTASAAVFIVSGTSGGNPVSAEAVVTAGAGTLSIDVTNTVANFNRSSQAIRGIEIDFEIDPTSFLTFTADGQLANISTNANPDTATLISGEPTRWTAALGGGVLLLDVGGNQPRHMIAGAVPIGNANAGVGNFNPYLLGTGFFDLTFAPGFTPHVTSISFLFGTGPDAILSTTCDRDCIVVDPCANPMAPGCGGSNNSVPEPNAWALMIVGFGGVGYAIRRRRYAIA